MAYQFFGSSHPHIQLSAIPTETTSSSAASSLTTNVAAPTHSSDVKEEVFGATIQELQHQGAASFRPAKKQKIAAEGRSHRFVSQKKWKFSDAQPWLPSKVSSKAQNASKTGSKAKKEPSSPRILPMSSVKPNTTSINTRQVPLSNHVIRSPASSQVPQYTHTASTVSSGPNQNDISSIQSLPYVTPNSRHKITSVSSSVAQSSPKVSSGPTSNAPMPENSAQTDTQANQDSVHVSDAISISASQAVLSKLKSSRGVSTLSLEKDAERIAALIAEKRKENESSMFRERMLKRQLEHRTHRDQRHASQESTSAQSVSPIQNHIDIPRHSESPGQESSSSNPSTVVQHHQHLPLQQPSDQSRIQDIRDSWNSSTAGQTSINDSVIRTYTRNIPANSNLSNTPISEMRNPPNYNEHEILFGRQQSSRVSPAATQVQSRKTFTTTATPIQALNATTSFDADNDHTASRRPVLHHQMAQGSLQNVHTQDTNNVQQMRPQYYFRQASSPLPNAQPEHIQRTGSTNSLHRQPSLETSIGSIPSPMSISSQSPTSMSIRHFSQIDISTQPQAYSATYPSMSDRTQTSSAGQMSMNAAAYYAMNRQLWTPSQRHAGSAMNNQAAHDVPPARSHNTNVAPVTTARQQKYPQPPILASNTNMFSGNSRSSAVVDPDSIHAKPRVNMFSNTRGTAFPMQEVIRQIEMT